MKPISLLCLIVCGGLPVAAQSDTQTFKINAPIAPLTAQLGPISDASHPILEPYRSGLLRRSDVPALLLSLKSSVDGQPPDTVPSLQTSNDIVTIIHLLRWKDANHTAIQFEKWYLYDPVSSKTSFYLQTAQQVFQRATIPGRKKYQLLYIHLKANPEDTNESITVNPVSYTLTVTKQQPQLIMDLKSVAAIVGLNVPPEAASVVTQPGYWSAAPFNSASSTSKIVVAASLDKNGNASSEATTTQLSSKTYTNEKPAWIGLGFAVPVTGYKDVTYSQTAGTIVPQTVDRKTVALTVDVFVPPAEPGLTTFRYIPHLVLGVPIKGKVLQHTFVGAGIGLHWLSPYAGVTFDTQAGATTGTNPTPGHLVMKGTFGIEISVSSAAALLKGK